MASAEESKRSSAQRLLEQPSSENRPSSSITYNRQQKSVFNVREEVRQRAQKLTRPTADSSTTNAAEAAHAVYFTEELNASGDNLRQKNKSVFDRLYNKKTTASQAAANRSATEMQGTSTVDRAEVGTASRSLRGE